jgi:predicted TIM-barrel fold metal-dependent hydrolase
MIVPWTKNDKVRRYAAFIKAAYRKTQENNFLHLINYYPERTKFVILPMDMAYMGAGKVKEDIDEQHNELARIAKDPRYSDTIIPFAHVEPRRPEALNRLKLLVEEHDFKGVKIYPTLGYRPDDKVLMDEIYPYMVEQDIPLMAHCSPGSVNSKDMSRDQAHALADPDNYKKVMKSFPDLRICLAHFGGIGEWRRHINETRDPANPTWLKKIRELITNSKYPNLFTDISYTIFNFHENVPLLKILMEDKKILEKVLFGSDFYMVESEKYSEKRFSIDLRYALGEAIFWKIAYENPKEYLK